ncbi:MAG: MMPL family transporter [Verrucomicrobiota bacterium]
MRKWRKDLADQRLGSEAIDELEVHLRDHIEYRMGEGLSEEQAFVEGIDRIGGAREICEEFSKIRRLRFPAIPMGAIAEFQARLASRGRWYLAVLWVLMVVGAVCLLPKLDFRFNLGQMLRGDDDRIKEVRSFYKTFPPSDGHLMVAATSQEQLTIDHLRAAERWAQQFRKLPEVKDVISPRLLLDLELDGFTLDEWARLGGTGDEPLEFGNGPGMASFRGHLISNDQKSVALYLIKNGGSRAFHRAVESMDALPWPDAEIRVVGPSYLLGHMDQLLRANFQSILLFESLAILLVVPLFMRSLRRAYLPFAVALSALLFYLALFVLTGQRFGVMHLAGPGLILVIGLADAIHLQQKFDDARREGHGVAESLRLMFQSVGRACVLTTLTTACGFLSLLVAPHEEIYDFGLWCTIGVLTAFATVTFFLPVFLAIFPGKGSPATVAPMIHPRRLHRFAAPVCIGLVILAAGIHRTHLDSSLERELPESAKPVRDASWFAEHFRGLDRVEVDLRANLLDPEVVAVIERMQSELREFPGISGSRSYIDAMRMTLAPEVIETEDGLQLGAAALGRGVFPRHLLTQDLDRACIVFFRTRDFGTDRYETFRDRVQEYARELPGESSMRLNGSIPMFYESTTMISKTMILSLVGSFSMITLILMIVLRSVKLGLICLVPNVLPLLVVAGVSGWMGESLHLGILIVFSVGLGLAVDDTIHLMVRYQQLQKEKPGSCHRALMDEAVTSAGFAIVLTSVVLLISAICFLASSFSTMRGIGITLGIVAVAALLADLIVLPWLIEKLHRRPLRSLPSAA